MWIILQVLIVLGVMTALLFGLAGRLDLPFFWAYLALMFGSGVANLCRLSPDLVRERVHPGPGGTDCALRFLSIPFFLAAFIVVGLDARFGWSNVPTWVQTLAFFLAAAGLTLFSLAMQANPFFSSVVRIQTERGHHLITGGPYRVVRHPGYLGGLVYIALAPPALGSWWGLIPAVLMAVFILRRAVIEDRFLRANLPGYVEYSARVRYRLVPGVW